MFEGHHMARESRRAQTLPVIWNRVFTYEYLMKTAIVKTVDDAPIIPERPKINYFLPYLDKKTAIFCPNMVNTNPSIVVL